MSGQKVSYIRMEEREARRLREQDVHFRAVQRDLPERLSSIQNDMQAQIDRQRSRTDARMKDLERMTKNLQTDLAESERRQQKRLREGLENVQRQMSEQIAAERADREQQARIMRQEYRSLIAEEKNERQRQMRVLEDRLSNIETREATLTKMAKDSLEDLRLVFEEVEKLPHQRFAPGKLSRISMLIQQANNNLVAGASQAALVGTQDCYLDLIELRAEVIYQEQMFEQAYLKAWQTIKSLLAEIEAHKQATVFPKTEKEFEFEVDFWSNGKLSDTANALRKIEQHLEKEKEHLTIEEVKSLEENAGLLRQQMLAAIDAAKIAIINSQACYNVSQIVEDVLMQQGYEVTDGVYEGEDQRRAYALKMRNHGGDEVVTIVTPSTERELEYQMQMNFFDRSQDEAMRQNFAKKVRESLGKFGLESFAAQTTRDIGEPDESVKDMEKFRQKRISNASSSGANSIRRP